MIGWRLLRPSRDQIAALRLSLLRAADDLDNAADQLAVLRHDGHSASVVAARAQAARDAAGGHDAATWVLP